MQKKKVLVIVVSIVLGMGLGAGAWWVWQKPGRSTIPSAQPSGSSATTSEEKASQELAAQLKEIEEAINSGIKERQDLIFVPFMRPLNKPMLPMGVTVQLEHPTIIGHTATGTARSSDNRAFEVGYVYTSETENGPSRWYLSYAEEK